MLDENRLHAPPEMDVDVAYLAPIVGDLAECAIDVVPNEMRQGQAQSDESDRKDDKNHYRAFRQRTEAAGRPR